MIEVEAKIKISNPKELRERISKITTYRKKEVKIDHYYTLDKNKYKYPTKSIRVRKINNYYKINFKQKLSYVKGVYAKDEREFEVTDIKNFLNLIKDFGFRLWLIKEKYSESYEIKKNFHIELNNVKNLGWFVEIEYLTDKKNIEKARKKIQEIIKRLSLEKEEIIKEGYTKLLWNKKFEKSKQQPL